VKIEPRVRILASATHRNKTQSDDVACDVACDVAGDEDGDRTEVMTWRVSPTRFAEAGRRWSVARVRRVGARGQSGRRRVGARAGMQDVGYSPGFQQGIRPVVLYTMIC
jgi:hypothetical protein